MFRTIRHSLLPVLLIVGLSSCSQGSPAPAPTESIKNDQTSERVNVSTEASSALCTRLDYLGNRDDPTSATLSCQDGDVITIPGPFPVGKSFGEQIALPDGGTKPGKDGNALIASKLGKHHVWYYLVADGGELRVWYDDELVQHSTTGETTSSRIAMRNFQKTDITTSVVWK